MYTIIFYVWIVWISLWFLQAFLLCSSGIASLCGGRCYQFWFLPRMWDDYQAPFRALLMFGCISPGHQSTYSSTGAKKNLPDHWKLMRSLMPKSQHLGSIGIELSGMGSWSAYLSERAATEVPSQPRPQLSFRYPNVGVPKNGARGAFRPRILNVWGAGLLFFFSYFHAIFMLFIDFPYVSILFSICFQVRSSVLQAQIARLVQAPEAEWWQFLHPRLHTIQRVWTFQVVNIE